LTGTDHTSATAGRLLGVLGILGGAILLVAFLPSIGIPRDLNAWRLVLYNLGAIAIAVAALRVGALGSATWAWSSAIAVIATNAAYLGFTLVATTRAAPFAGEFGLAWDVVAFLMWLSDGWLGLALVRAGRLTRWGAAALAIGSPLAILGMSRLELTSPADPTIFEPIALAGLALNGLGWILLGLDLVRSSTAGYANLKRSSPGSQGFPSP
jgi:hypothetical protein